MAEQKRKLRNPGPRWGCRFLSWACHDWPDWLFRPALKAGVFVATCCMGPQRRCSRDYLSRVLPRRARFRDAYLHFLALAESLVFKLRVARDPALIRFRLSDTPGKEAFMRLARSERPALFGTFHVGHSDLLGCMLAEFGRSVRMVRERVGNAYDIEELGRAFGRNVEFVWINEGESLLFALKSVAEDGASLALQCDREAHSSRHGVFHFLGARRRFPVTIYHLAYLFRMPVAFSFAIPVDTVTTEVVCSEVFDPEAKSKREVMEEGCRHFQGVLMLLESVLGRYPYAWFNFLPLNSEMSDDAA